MKKKLNILPRKSKSPKAGTVLIKDCQQARSSDNMSIIDHNISNIKRASEHLLHLKSKNADHLIKVIKKLERK